MGNDMNDSKYKNDYFLPCKYILNGHREKYNLFGDEIKHDGTFFITFYNDSNKRRLDILSKLKEILSYFDCKIIETYLCDNDTLIYIKISDKEIKSLKNKIKYFWRCS